MKKPKKKGSVKKRFPRSFTEPVGVPHRGMSPVVVCTDRQVDKIGLEWHRIFGADWREKGAWHLLTNFEGWIYEGTTAKADELAQQEAVRYLTQLLEMPSHAPVRITMTPEERKEQIRALWGN